jgi:uracil-DNA glycosylase
MTDTAGLPFVDYQFPSEEAGEARIAFVGEAPGAEEARMGRPFVGRSGRLLDEALAATGIERSRCLIANVFRYQPPGNKVGHFFASRARAKRDGLALDERWGAFGTSDRLLAAFSGEIDHLARTLATFAPKVVIALGRTPTWALTGRNGILDLRGRALPCRLLEGVSVIPTFHPSFILRGQFNQLPVFRADLALAREIALGTGG